MEVINQYDLISAFNTHSVSWRTDCVGAGMEVGDQ